MDAPILNLSAYRFVPLAYPVGWREAIRRRAGDEALKGTVLLAGEGINLALAGPPAGVHAFTAWLGAQAPFAGMSTTLTRSAAVPFNRLVVKVKPEIIRMNRPAIQPQRGRAPSVDAVTLARWLDAGVDDGGWPVALLDTRNGFEVDRGRFQSALDWRLGKFSDFPDALRAHRAELDGKTVVAYCTGGIRCEKAALLMQAEGVARVHQLEGGILRYLQHAGSRHFDGHCAVFDRCAALDDALAPAGTRAFPSAV